MPVGQGIGSADISLGLAVDRQFLKTSSAWRVLSVSEGTVLPYAWAATAAKHNFAERPHICASQDLGSVQGQVLRSKYFIQRLNKFMDTLLSVAEPYHTRRPITAVDLNAQGFEGWSEGHVLVTGRHFPAEQPEELADCQRNNFRFIQSGKSHKITKEVAPSELQSYASQPPQ
eukprot:s2606_g14.t1